MIQMIKITTAVQAEEMQALACEIWRECYKEILSSEQIEYMLGKYLTADVLMNALNEGYSHYLVKGNTGYIGFISVRPDGDRLFLSKLYLRSSCRGKGIGSRMMSFVEGVASGMGKNAVYLTVNKNNPSFEVYKARGFEVEREQIADIGSGFVMDDYVMVKPL